MRSLRLFASSLALAALAVAHADFVNGSFETPAITTATISPVSGTDMPGWNLTNLGYLVSNGFSGSGTGVNWYNTPDGNQYLYMSANTADSTLSQTVNLAAGGNTLSFDMADFNGIFNIQGGAIDVMITRVSDSSVVVPLTHFTTPDQSSFITQTLTFSAPAAGDYEFDFMSVNGHAGLIDGVSVKASPVPEPTTFAALGLGTLVALRRRKRA